MATRIEARRPSAAAPAGSRVAPPCAFVVFCAAGDLTRRKLMPAIARLIARGSILDPFGVVGVALKAFAPRAFAAGLTASLGEFAPETVKYVAVRVPFPQRPAI